MYGWIDENKNIIKSISVKKPLTNPSNDPIVIGTFTYKHFDIFKKSSNSMIKRKAKINGEYYVDTSINDAIKLGYKCAVFEVDYYFCWGTPNELKTYNYWQSCFDKWDKHPYKKSLDKVLKLD